MIASGSFPKEEDFATTAGWIAAVDALIDAEIALADAPTARPGLI